MLNAREKVLNIEIASDKIVERLKVTDVSVNALRRLKEDIAVIRAATDETLSSYSEVLDRILGYINDAVMDPDSIEFCAERVHDHVAGYILEHNRFDLDYEADKDKAIRGRISIKRTTAEIEEIEARMKDIEEEWISNNYPTDSARYKTLVSEHGNLQSMLNDMKFKLSALKRMNEANVSIRSAVERRQFTENVKAGITMGADEYSDLVMENKELESDLFAELEAIKRVSEEASVSSVMPEVDDSAFRRAVEETLLERMYKSNTAEYESRISTMQEDELLSAMLQVARRLGDLEGLVTELRGEQKRQAEQTREQLEELLANTAYLSAIREDTSGDIVKEVEHHLSRTPADIQSAQLKIRVCIELYCRFIKGIKLTDKLFFSAGEKVYKKFAAANAGEHDSELVKIYSATNAYIHTENKVIIMTDSERECAIAEIKENARKLHDWRIDQYDIRDGLKQYCITRDKMLLKILEDGKINKKFVDAESGTNGSLTLYFNEGADLLSTMRNLNVDIPSIRFKSMEDINAYLGAAESITDTSKVPEPVQARAEPVRVMQSLDNKKARRESEILKYFPESKYGFIKNPDKPNDNRGIHFKVKGDDRGYVRGAKVSYVMGKNYMGECAEDVILIASAQMTH